LPSEVATECLAITAIHFTLPFCILKIGHFLNFNFLPSAGLPGHHLTFLQKENWAVPGTVQGNNFTFTAM